MEKKNQRFLCFYWVDEIRVEFWDSFFAFNRTSTNISVYNSVEPGRKCSPFPLENTATKIKSEITHCDYQNEEKCLLTKSLGAHEIIGSNEK